MLCVAPLCLPHRVAELDGGVSERVSEFLRYIRTPSSAALPPTQSELLVPASTPHSTNQATACLLIMWYPSDSQRTAYGIPAQSRVVIGQQDAL